MKRRISILLAVAVCLAGLLLIPGEILTAQEQRLYGRKTSQEVLTPQFAADAGTLFQRLKVLVQYGQATELSGHAGSDLYYDKEALLDLYHRELSTLAQTNPLAKTLLPALEDLLEQDQQDDALEASYSCVVNLSTGSTFLLSRLRSTQFTFILEMDMVSGKLISFCADRELCENPEQVLETQWSCFASLGEYLGLTCITESNQEGNTQYTFQEPEGDGSTLTFLLRLDEQLQVSPIPDV